ncbi:hypothetical protein [Blastococcus litoris]|uniref:hypothetical protein n=1 Tax=Blastococcus litoris TaxID=2171622 RepID=UPI000E308F8D|nr:hypothetical protein [Blastococcus litoris]
MVIRARRVAGPAAALLVVAVCAGCGFLEDLATPDDPAPAAPSAPAVTAAPAEPAPRQVLAVPLEDDRDFPFSADVSVVTWPALDGLPPLGSRFDDDCGLADDATTQYVPVEVSFGNRSEAVAALSAGVALFPAGGSGDVTEEVGLFIASGDPTVRYCQGGDTTPAGDHFAVGADAQRPSSVWLYLVRRAPTPEERARGQAVFAALGLRFSALENPVDSVPGPWKLGHWTATRPPSAGAPCPDDATALCAKLG